MKEPESPDQLYDRALRHGDIWSLPQDAEHGELLVRAAELGCVQAQRDLGCCYATGDAYFARDLATARVWYGRAAAAGHADAQYNYGCMLLFGEGGLADPDAGMTFVRQAAAQNDPCALHFLDQGPPSSVGT